MTPTDRVVLDQLVQATKVEIAPKMKDDDFFELFCAQSQTQTSEIIKAM